MNIVLADSSRADKRLLVVLDVDSTLIDNEVIELLADFAGTRVEVAAITESAMRGEIDFSESLIQRVRSLKGLPISVFEDVSRSISVTQGAQQLIATVHEHDGIVGVVSGGFHEVLDPLAESLNIDVWKANRLDVVNGFLTGHVLGEIVDAQAKKDALELWATQYQIDLNHTVAIGDGANDLLMMERAGVGIAFCAKPIVQNQADVVINIRDLSEALKFIGL
jgi:phosphoserine phosphatase